MRRGVEPSMNQIVDCAKKEPKIVLCGRLCRGKKIREVRIVRACMSERGFMGHLLHVKTPFKAHRNLQSLGSKA